MLCLQSNWKHCMQMSVLQKISTYDDDMDESKVYLLHFSDSLCGVNIIFKFIADFRKEHELKAILFLSLSLWKLVNVAKIRKRYAQASNEIHVEVIHKYVPSPALCNKQQFLNTPIGWPREQKKKKKKKKIESKTLKPREGGLGNGNTRNMPNSGCLLLRAPFASLET